jgi:hypothetical protein
MRRRQWRSVRRHCFFSNQEKIMKKATCSILLVMILGASTIPSFAQYRKPVSEMSDEELSALIREQRDKFERYTRRTRAALSSFIGQDISLGLDGFALLNRYYPNLIAAIAEKVNQAASDPMNMIKSTKAELPPGTTPGLINDPSRMAWAIMSFADELVENDIEQDLRDIFRDEEQYPDDQIEAWAEQISDQMLQDQADALREQGNHAQARLLELYKQLEAAMEYKRRRELRRHFVGPQPGPARGAPTGQPGPQGWILGRPGGNGSSRGEEVVTVTGGGCVTVTYDENNNPILIIEPCK